MFLKDWKPEKNSVLVFGNELQGVSFQVLKKADEVVEISRIGNKGSLNVATTAGIVIEKLLDIPGTEPRIIEGIK